MASSSSATKSSSFLLLLLLLLVLISSTSCSITETEPTPTPWPQQFHSLVVTNQSGDLQVIDLWYDWPNGRNLNVIQYQLGQLFYSYEWNNGTSFFYTTSNNYQDYQYQDDCNTSQFEVGILRPNWLEGANYLGQRRLDGFLCNVWEKVDGFIYYYEDILTNRPVYWLLFNGRASHVMTFEVGAVLEDAKWQAPAICFEKQDVNADPAAGIRADKGFQDHLIDGILRGSMQY